MNRRAGGSKADIWKGKRNFQLPVLPGMTPPHSRPGAESVCRPRRNGNLQHGEATDAFILGVMNGIRRRRMRLEPATAFAKLGRAPNLPSGFSIWREMFGNGPQALRKVSPMEKRFRGPA